MVEKRGLLKRMMHPLAVSGAYLFLYIPIVILIIFSFNASDVSFSWQGFSLRWYRELWSSVELLRACKVSFVVAASSTLLSTALGTALVVGGYWWRPRFLYSFFYANIILPDIILAVGLMATFTMLNIPLGYPSLIVGHTLLGLGFVIPIMRARFADFDASLVEASFDLGGNHFQTCRRVILPLLMPAFVASSLLVFTLSLDDFMISFFCSGPQIQTLSIFVYYTIRTLVSPSVNAISACILAFSSLVIMVLCYLRVVDRAFLHD